MFRSRFTVLLVIAGFALLLFGGCSSDSKSLNDSPVDELNLTSEFGGYSAADEPPSFDDPALASMVEGEMVDDPISAAIDEDTVITNTKPTVYALAIRWGMLEGDSSVTTPTDWSGSIKVDFGGIKVDRILRFERGQDYVVLPRDSRKEVAWVSQTTVHWDGLLLTIVDPMWRPDTAGLANHVTFSTGPYSRTFELTELTELDEIVDVDNLGNQISFTANVVALEPCGGGPLAGVWAKHPHAPRGHFYGVWMADNGLLIGHLKGHFGTIDDGTQVFYGKYISRMGRFKGLLRGQWGTDDSAEISGWFEGNWYSRNGAAIGRLHGEWSSVMRDGRDKFKKDDTDGSVVDDIEMRRQLNKGYFAGRWSQSCDANVDDDVEGDNDGET